MMKILFVGLGSIGTRHIKNCVTILSDMDIGYEMDALRSSDKPLVANVQALLTASYSDAKELPYDYDVAFITNPTILHYSVIQSLLPHVKNMFIEKPIFENCSYDLTSLPFRADGVYYVACPMRYTRVFQKMKAITQNNQIISARAICSSYLPDWRKNTDYRKNYSARHELGGGVTIDLIHEWDYLRDLFGVPEEMSRICGKFSNLELSSDDTALYLARYADKTVELHLDYYGRVSRRELELYTEEDVIIGDFNAKSVRWLKSGQAEQMTEDGNDCYLEELRHFFALVCGDSKANPNSVLKAFETLGLATGGKLI